MSCTGTSVRRATGRRIRPKTLARYSSTPCEKSTPNVGAGQFPSVWACSTRCNAAAHSVATRGLRVISSGSSGIPKYAMYQECSACVSICRRSPGLRVR